MTMGEPIRIEVFEWEAMRQVQSGFITILMTSGVFLRSQIARNHR